MCMATHTHTYILTHIHAQSSFLPTTLKHEYNTNRTYCLQCMPTSPGSRLVVTGGGDETAVLSCPYTGQIKCAIPKQGGTVFQVDFSSDGRLLASGTTDETYRIWELHAEGPPTLVKTLQSGKGQPRGVKCSPDCQWVAACSTEGVVVWSVLPGEERSIYKDSDTHVHSLAWTHDSKLIMCIVSRGRMTAN